MPFYSIGWAEGSDGQEDTFSFGKRLSQQDLLDYVNRAASNAIRYALDHKDSAEYGQLFERKDDPITEHLYPRIVEELILMGFRPVEIKERLYMDGLQRLDLNKPRSSVYGVLLEIPQDLREELMLQTYREAQATDSR